MAQTTFLGSEPPRARFEIRGGEHASAGSSTGLLSFAKAIRAARGDLAGTLEHRIRSLDEGDRQALVGELLTLEHKNPGAFLAGALAGFVLGRAASESASRRQPGYGPTAGSVSTDELGPGETGVVCGPIETAQTGPGGLGYLETPVPEDDVPGRK